MTKVTRYEANDGSLHKTQKECDAKNIELRTAPLIEEFANALTGTEPGLSTAENGSLQIDLADLPTFLTAHADALRTLLNRAVQPAGRPRKPRDPSAPRKPRAKKGDTPAAEQKPTQAEQTPASAPQPAAGADPVDELLADLG